LTIPETWVLVENLPELSLDKEKPVRKPESIGETPISPVIFDLDEDEMPAFARMT
jgi:hypothetical protein